MHHDSIARNSMVLREHFLTPLKLLHFCLTVAFFWGAWEFYYIKYDMGFNEKYNVVIPLIYAISFFYLNQIYNGYFISFCKPKKLIFAQTLASLLCVSFIYFGTAIVWMRWRNPSVLILYFTIQVFVNCAWSYFADYVYYKFHQPLKTVLVYGRQKDLERAEQVRTFNRKFDIVLEIKTSEKDLFNKIAGCEAIFILGADKVLRDKLGVWALENGVSVFAFQDLEDILLTNAGHLQSFGTPLLALNARDPSLSYMCLKRSLSFVIAFFGLIVASPIMLCAVLAIKLFDPGPVLFKQKRMGRGLKPFTCYKFRTMSVAAPADVAANAIDAKRFLSPLGNFLRSTSIDELPQLVNILKGDMGFIGPRPLVLSEKEIIAKRAQLGIYKIRPGLSGLAQVMGRNQVNDTEKLIFDYEYLTKMNLFLDIKIFFMTVYYVLARRGIFDK